jgi:hypothetical protein
VTGNGLLVLLALWLQGALTLALLWHLGSIRLPLVSSGKIAIGAIALSREPWPDREKQASNAFDNQFQLPVLVFVAGAAALYLGPSVLEVVLAWLFVLSRIVHAAIHVTSNHVVRRFWAYSFGYAVLIALWLDLLVRLLPAALHAAP